MQGYHIPPNHQPKPPKLPLADYTGWGPRTSYKWSITPSCPFIRSFKGVIIPFITSRGPPFTIPETYIPRNLQQDPLNGPLNLSIESNISSNLLRGPLVRSYSIFDGYIVYIGLETVRVGLNEWVSSWTTASWTTPATISGGWYPNPMDFGGILRTCPQILCFTCYLVYW